MGSDKIQALNEKNYKDILTKISPEEAEERFEYSDCVMNLYFDEDSGIKDPSFYFYEGDLHVSSLTFGETSGTAKFNLIVNGSLYSDGNIILSSDRDMGFVIVYGDVTAKNVIVSGCTEFYVTGSLTAKNIIFGHSGNNGILGVDEAVSASFIINISEYTMYFYDEINAAVLGNPIYTSNETDYEDDQAAEVLLGEFVGEDGRPDTAAVIRAVYEDRNILKPGIGSSHTYNDENPASQKSSGSVRDIILEAQKFTDTKDFEQAYIMFRSILPEVKPDRKDYDSLYYYYIFLFSAANYIETLDGAARTEVMKEYIRHAQTLLDAVNAGPDLFYYSEKSKFDREVRRTSNNGIGWYLMELGEYEKALPYAEAAVSMIESEADDYALETLALILLGLNRKDDAYRLIKRTLDRKPDYRYFLSFLEDDDYLTWKDMNFQDNLSESRTVKEAVENFNSYVAGLGSKDDRGRYCSPVFEFGNTADEKQITLLKKAFGIPMPEDLEEFYRTLGSIIRPKEYLVYEDHYIDIFSAQTMLKSLEENGGDCRSFGLVDMIVGHWEGDRYEFTDDLEDYEEEMFDEINRRYKCIGEYALDWSFEESYYIFFDEHGRFGAVRYHQDEYDALTEQFEALLNGNGPELSLKEVTEKALNEIKDVIEIS